MSSDCVVETAADLGSVVKQARRSAGITQQRLADSVGVSRQWIIRLEQGHHQMEMGAVFEVLLALNLELTATVSHAS